jgi:hypothetical protein
MKARPRDPRYWQTVAQLVVTSHFTDLEKLVHFTALQICVVQDTTELQLRAVLEQAASAARSAGHGRRYSAVRHYTLQPPACKI